MQLASLSFLLLGLPLLLLIYYCIPAKGKQIYLLFSSLLLYSWGSWLKLFYLAGFIFYDYIIGLVIEKYKRKKIICSNILLCSVILQVAEMVWIRSIMQMYEDVMFLIGIAVCTLQGLGYLINIYRNKYPAEVNFIRLGVYFVMFPILLAGPVFSYEAYLKQLEHRKLNIIALSDGLSLFIRGLAQKVVLANTFGYIFKELKQISPDYMSMLTAWLITIVFSMYLYFELLSYSEMARGLGKCFGYELPKNFSHPFFTSSITAFIQSWNITLVLWFQDNFMNFLFPQNKNNNKWKYFLGLIIMGILIGSWYGVKLQFLVWGFLMGVLLVLDKLVIEKFIRKRYIFGLLYTGILLQFLWVLFFADNLKETVLYWKAMLGFCNGITDSNGTYFFMSYIGLLLIGFYVATDLFRNITERFTSAKIGQKFVLFTPVFQGILLIFCIAFMLYGEQNSMLWLCI